MVATGIVIANGVVEIVTDVDDKGITKNADAAAETFEEKFTRSVDGRLRDSKGRFLKSAENSLGGEAGKNSGLKFGLGFFSGIIGNVTQFAGGITRNLVPAVGAAIAPVGALANAVVAFGPALLTAGQAVVTFGSNLLAAAPLILGMGVQLGIAKAVITGLAPAIVKEMSPITEAFQDGMKAAEGFATGGIKPLAEEFVRLNMGSIRTMLMSIGATTNDVVRGFLEWTNTVPGMTAISEITTGVWTMLDNIAPSVQGVAISFVAMLGRISDVSAAAGSAGLAGALDKVNGMLDRITGQTVLDGLKGVADALKSIRDFVMGVVDAVKWVIDFYRQWRTEINLVLDALALVAIIFGGPVTIVIALVALVVRHFQDLKNLLATAREWFSGVQGGSDILARIKDGALQVWESIKRFATELWAAVQGPMASFWDTIQNKFLPAFGNFVAAILPIVAALIDRFGPAIAGAIVMLIKFADFTMSTVATVLEFLTWLTTVPGKVKEKVDAVVAWFQAMPGKVKNALTSLPGVVANALESAGKKALFAIGYFIGAAIAAFLAWPGKIRTAMATIPGIVGSIITTAGSRAKTAASNFISQTVAIFKTLPGKAKSAISGVPGQIKSVFSGSGNWLVSAGTNILMGLVRGMKGAVGAAVNQATNAAKSVIGGLKKGLGINSPSKVAEEEVGQYVMPGVGRGIEKSVPKFERQVQGIAPVAAQTAVSSTAAATMAAAPSSSSGTHIENLNVNVKGMLSPDDPVAMRRLIAALYEELARYEKSHA